MHEVANPSTKADATSDTTRTGERLMLVPACRTVDAKAQLVHVALLDLLWKQSAAWRTARH